MTRFSFSCHSLFTSAASFLAKQLDYFSSLSFSLSLLLLLLIACSTLSSLSYAAHLTGAQALSMPAQYNSPNVPTFLDDSVKEIRKFISATTSFSARVVVKQDAIGIAQPVSADGYIQYSAPSNLLLKIEGGYPYTVHVSATNVTTIFPLTLEKDVRPLLPYEKLWDDFLGISCYTENPAFLRQFKVENKTFVVYARRKDESIAELRKNIMANYRHAIFRLIRLDPRTGRILETQKTTLLNETTTIYFKEIEAHQMHKKTQKKGKEDETL